MEKEGQPPRDYFGSGTHLEGGLKVGLQVYDYPLNLDALPKYGAQSVLEGYRITHVGVLVSGSIPTAGNAPTIRLFYIASEATLAIWVWGFKHRPGPDHPDLPCCGWDLATFKYEGLCSHSPFNEPVSGNFDLTPEQLDTIAA
jgi:hypothetical protein